MKNDKRVGLALSGGGYRAAAYHLGTLRALYEMNALDKVDVLSTISGGSITGAAYSLKTTGYPEFEKQMIHILTTKSVIRYVLFSFMFLKTLLFLLVFIGGSVYALFTPYAWASPVLLLVMTVLLILFQYKIFPVSRRIEKAYDKFFFHNKTLSELGSAPLMAIGSTNIQTCRPFTFSHDFMGDSLYTFAQPPVLFNHVKFPVSRAVMASSCVPFAFVPVQIDEKDYINTKLAKDFKPVLVDGGVYDNQGIHKLTQEKSHFRCDIIVVSDAGNKPAFKKSFNNVFVLLIRTMDVFMARIKDIQMSVNLFGNVSSGLNREITYVSLGWNLDEIIPRFINNLTQNNIPPSVVAAHAIPPALLTDPKTHADQIRQYLENKLGYAAIAAGILNPADLACARSVGTNLTKLSTKQLDCLFRHAENITRLQVKLYCPSL